MAKTDTLGSCSRWNQCQSDWGSWAVVLCVENTCVCNPYWGYGGEDCMEPTSLTIVQRFFFSILMVAVILYVILSLCYVKSYVLFQQRRFCWKKMSPKGVAIMVNAFITAPSGFLIVLGCFSAVTFDPQMHLISSVFEVSFACSVLGVSFQTAILGLTWIEAALSIGRFSCAKRNWKKIKFATFTYSALLSVSVLVLHLIRKSSPFQLAIALESAGNLIVIMQIPIGLFGGLVLSSSMITYGAEGSGAQYEGKIIRKCSLLMLVMVFGYGFFAVFRSGVVGYGWFLAICNGLCVLFGLLYVLIFLFYVDHSGLYFNAASRKNVHSARVHPVSNSHRLNAHHMLAPRRSHAEFS